MKKAAFLLTIIMATALANAELQTNRLSALSSTILFKGDENVGYRAPLLLWRDGTFHMFLTLGQKDWPWAQGRIKAGYVADLRNVPGVGKYLMVFHGTGPDTEPVKFLTHGCIGIAWSDDLKTWSWPGRN